jgi:hypothetical protein
MGISVIMSAGATIAARQHFVDPHSGATQPISARSRTPRSFMTAIRADIGEAESYKQALLQGEIGLQQPMGANVAGVDFITAIRLGPASIRELVCTDVKTSGTGRFPRPKTVLPGTWQSEVADAVSRPRLRLRVTATDIAGEAPLPLPDAAELLRLEEAIIQAFTAGLIRLRQLNADYSPAGQGTITGW